MISYSSYEAFSTTRKAVTARPVLSNKSDDKFETSLFLSPSLISDAGGLRTKGLFKKNEPNRPLVTIITVVFDGAEDLEKTLLSVLNQSYDNVEYIVVDGGSTDGTLDIVRKYDHAIDYWISEKDGGIYDAMNKGIRLATGNWVNFMNSGDLFYENTTLDKIEFKYRPNFSILYGDIQTFSKKHQFNIRKVSGSVSVQNLVMKMPICHQSMFVTLQSFKHIGLFDTNYKICADHDWLIKALLAGQQASYVNKCIALCNLDGVSSTSIFQRKRERLAIALIHFDTLKPKIYFTAMVSFIKAPFTFCLSKLNLIGVGHRFKTTKKI
jgi:glycosyltransferase involved in cell wall biosynthesis